MGPAEWLNLLRSRGCLFDYTQDWRNHFVGTSGKHLNGYCCLDPLLCDPALTWEAAGQVATAFGSHGELYQPDAWPEVVVVPAVGEIALVHAVATQLVHDLPTAHVGAVWADKVSGGELTRLRIQRLGFAQHVAGKRALVVLDFINQMHTARQLIAEVERLGGRVVGVAAIVSNGRSGVSARALDVPAFYRLCEFSYDTWEPDECTKSGPCSRQSYVVVDPGLGHGEAFRREHPELPDSRFITLSDAT